MLQLIRHERQSAGMARNQDSRVVRSLRSCAVETLSCPCIGRRILGFVRALAYVLLARRLLIAFAYRSREIWNVFAIGTCAIVVHSSPASARQVEHGTSIARTVVGMPLS